MLIERLIGKNKKEQEKPQGVLLIITGPTGSGKDAVMEKFLNEDPSFTRIVSYATREKRFLTKENRWEEDGVDYHFVTRERFEEMIKNGEMIEYVQQGDDYKGTSTGSLREALDRVLAGDNIVWRIDMSRSGTIEEYYEEKFPDIADQLRGRTKVAFIGVERLTILYDRYRKRETNPDRNEFRKRIREEWEQFKAGRFDKVIINRTGQLDQAVEDLSLLVNKI